MYKNVFRADLNVASESHFLIFSGSEFQTLGPANEKDLSPKVERRTVGNSRRKALEERRVLIGEYGLTKSDR